MAEPSPTDGLPFSQAAANNRGPILEQLRRLLAEQRQVVEVGAGTGQHALFFAAGLPAVHWQATEHPAALATLRLRCRAGLLANLAEPVALDIDGDAWPVPEDAAVYTANTLHIVSEDSVRAFFRGCAASPARQLIVYGPFNYGGSFTSESNARFDAWLRERDRASGLRDFEGVDDLARAGGFTLREDVAMPANNRLLCWERRRRAARGADTR
jgi:hypothetical protein